MYSGIKHQGSGIKSFLSESGSQPTDKACQHILDDVCDRIGRWADSGLGLRQMQREIGEQIGTQTGLRTLNEHLQAAGMAPTRMEFVASPTATGAAAAATSTATQATSTALFRRKTTPKSPLNWSGSRQSA